MGIRWTSEQLQDFLREQQERQARRAVQAPDPHGGYTPKGDRSSQRLPGAVGAKSARRSKYKNQPTVVNGERFDSKAEAAYSRYLVALRQQGELVPPYFLRQVPFHLPGGVIYRLDFLEFYPGGEVELVDIKGFMTPTSKLKLKQVEDLYDVRIICKKRKGEGFVEIDWR